MAENFDIIKIRDNHCLRKKITVEKLVDDIERNEIVLPVNHRKFSWSAEQIEKFFSGLTSSYGVIDWFTSFIFWSLYGDNRKNREIKFYKFIKNYPEEYPQIDSIKLDEGDYEHSLQGVWDGQQRITALYIGLKGSYEEKKLYFNTSECIRYERETCAFEVSGGSFGIFKFLNPEEANENWFEVEKVFTYPSKCDEYDIPGEILYLWRAFKKEKIVNLQVERFFDLEKFL